MTVLAGIHYFATEQINQFQCAAAKLFVLLIPTNFYSTLFLSD